MKLLRRHYLLEFLKLFFLVSLGLGSASSLIDLVTRMEAFSTQGPSSATLFLYAVLTLPRYLVYLLPISALAAGLFVFGQAGKRKETVAIKASGGSIRRLLVPFLLLGAAITLAGFSLSEFAVPSLMKKARSLLEDSPKKDLAVTSAEGSVWIRARDYVVHIDLYTPERGMLYGVSMMRLENDQLTERLEAKSGEWQPLIEPGQTGGTGPEEPGERPRGTWVLRGVIRYDIRSGTMKTIPEMTSDAIDPPDRIGKGMQRPEEMNARELRAYVKRLKEAGIKATKLTVDMHARVTFPIINIIMLIIGISLANRGEMKNGLVTAAFGIFLSLLYWAAYTAAISLGYTGMLPPVLAGWLIPLIFGVASIGLFLRIPE